VQNLDLGLVGGVLVAATTNGEGLREALDRLALPLGDERGMDLILGGQLGKGVLLPQGLESHLGLERSSVVGALGCHFLPPDVWADSS